MAYLHSDREQFRDAIDLAYEQTGVMVQAIEKDYYVTMLLRLLAQRIEMLQLLLRLGTFQLSDIFYNTVGGVLGGLMYCAVMKVRKRL